MLRNINIKKKLGVRDSDAKKKCNEIYEKCFK